MIVVCINMNTSKKFKPLEKRIYCLNHVLFSDHSVDNNICFIVYVEIKYRIKIAQSLGGKK